MLSTKCLSSSSNARDYYSHEDYYGAEPRGMWFGMGGVDLGVKENAKFNPKTDAQFRDILEGKMPNGQQLGRQDSKGKILHRPGVDLTFSSPKSFSIQMHVFADEQEKEKLWHARMEALHRTLRYIEESGLIYTRKGKGGARKEPIHKLTYALFEHTTNRKLEPQDHVHCFLANAVKSEDGRFGSITLDDLFQNTKFLGQMFRNELAIEVKRLGYQIRPTSLKDGSSSFELKDISQNLIDAFSTRRKEIEELCKKYGVTTKEGRDKIVINSRESKKTVPEHELKAAWQLVVDRISKQKTKINSGSLDVASALNKVTDFLTSITSKSKEQEIADQTRDLEGLYEPMRVARLSLIDVTYHESAFTKEAIYKRAFECTIGKVSTSDIRSAVTELIKNKEIIPSDSRDRIGRQLFVSEELLRKEKEMISFARKGLDSYAPIIKRENFRRRFDSYQKGSNRKYPINDQQMKAIAHVLTNKDKVTAIQGLPGVGKSTVLEAVRSMSQRRVIDLLGTAPTASAAKSLEVTSGIESRTLHSFVNKYRGFLEGRGTEEGLKATRAELGKGIIFVDEASLIGTRMMFNLLKLSNLLRFRVVLVGDTKQLSAVEAGKPFEQLLDVINSAKLDKILRQKEEVHKEAIKAVARNNILKSFKIHESNIKQSGNEFVSEAADKYLSLPKEERDKTFLISPTRKSRDAINQTIVGSLIESGEIRGKIIPHSTLKPVAMKPGSYGFAHSYKVGQEIEFFKDYKSYGIKRGETLEIKEINETSNTISFKKGLRAIRFRLATNVDYSDKFEVFEKSQIRFAEGLKIRITKNDKGLINSEVAEVKNLGRLTNMVTLEMEDKTTKVISMKDLKHIDYGYCSTIHSAQGKTTDRLIAAIYSHKHLNDQKSWLVTISRHKNDLHIYMDDKKAVQKQYTTNRGEVSSASELILNRSRF